jgi:hypothetical protein
MFGQWRAMVQTPRRRAYVCSRRSRRQAARLAFSRHLNTKPYILSHPSTARKHIGGIAPRPL